MSGSIGGLLGLIDQSQQNQVQQPPVQGLLGNATQLLPTDPFAAQRAAAAAAAAQQGQGGGSMTRPDLFKLDSTQLPQGTGWSWSGTDPATATAQWKPNNNFPIGAMVGTPLFVPGAQQAQDAQAALQRSNRAWNALQGIANPDDDPKQQQRGGWRGWGGAGEGGGEAAGAAEGNAGSW